MRRRLAAEAGTIPPLSCGLLNAATPERGHVSHHKFLLGFACPIPVVWLCYGVTKATALMTSARGGTIKQTERSTEQPLASPPPLPPPPAIAAGLSVEAFAKAREVSSFRFCWKGDHFFSLSAQLAGCRVVRMSLACIRRSGSLRPLRLSWLHAAHESPPSLARGISVLCPAQ